ncbi:Mitochondrial outer membrane protein iml2 [Friedmanniomyces endolithicus]|nr:Mitochondrial outer membrane protein iml2 [Friedmanniomyces endolithicus]KAK0785120.1 Mitochondrial outer membrane protein iml2 [Friedmanniomyces endolithicus]KAK0787962.1 Mitochondrial outer membrane protein iml2 [Friedmanniomyces endolithicus]KAK0839127.1 Mitochondrial outer membrane protein iml2 [Friedmanniomyces endolithicus]
MRRLGGLLGSRANISTSKSLTALDEPAAHVELAEAELSKGSSPFHKLGLSTALFLRAVLGFEKEVMEKAHACLTDAEEVASEHQRRAVRDPSKAHQSKIYSAGAEYALCHAESQLMSAVVAVLNESLTESLKGFYKLRKAFATLHDISEQERRYLGRTGRGVGSSQVSVVAPSSGRETPGLSSGVLTPADSGEEEDEDDFVDAKESGSAPGTPPPTYRGGANERSMEKLSLEDTVTNRSNGGTPPTNTPIESDSALAQADQEIDFRTITSDPIDLFIHSGTALCFGLLQVLLSMIPPAFARLLSLFSFRGDREAGLRMLWSASKFKHNINGAMAGLITLGFYNGAVAFCDILSPGAVPHTRLRNLLREMRELYPGSKLWLLEEARMLGADRQVERAIAIVDQGQSSGLKQVNALRMFERSLNCMYAHRYEMCAQGFIECVGMNSWSHGMYYYLAGSCYVELYRLHKGSDAKLAEGYAAKAEEYLHVVPQHVGKKGFMGKQLPFDTFVGRKIKKWDFRAEKWGCKMVDAVGVSPVEEMAYFWSGFRRRNVEQLRTSLERLAWSEDVKANPHWEQESADEKATLAMLRATCFRFLGEIPKAKTTITEGVFSHDLVEVKACDFPDTWSLPVAHYELAVCCWDEAGGQDGDRATLQKCSDSLLKVERWESYELEARVGLKITTGRETLRKCGISSP